MSSSLEAWQPFFNTALGIVLAAFLAFLAAKYWNARSEMRRAAELLEAQVEKKAAALEAANTALLSRVGELERQHAIIGQAMLPINALVQAALIKELTHFHEPRTDELLEKLGPPSTLTDDELSELERHLEERETIVDDQISQPERDAARMLPMVIRRVKAEEEDAATNPVTLRVVTITVGGKVVPVPVASTPPIQAAVAVAEAHQEEQAAIDAGEKSPS